MKLIAHRPQNWNQVIGQVRPIRLLHGVLRNQHAMTRGFIFGGDLGVGKTTTAYIFAKALLCTGDDPLGCGKCSSCKTPLEGHPDFTEVDAALHSGVAQARTLIEMSQAPALLAKRRVVMVDEAHNLSPEAWGVFLKPLEITDTSVVFLFVSNTYQEMPEDISSRCTELIFLPVENSTILGWLTNIASTANIPFEQSGLHFITTMAKGRPRNAQRMLSTVATIGPATLQTCREVLNNDAEDYCYRILHMLLDNSLDRACAIFIELGNVIGPGQAIDALFSLYAKEYFAADSFIHGAFTKPHEVTQILLRWSVPKNLPVDVLPLILLEMDGLRMNSTVKRAVVPTSPPPTMSKPKPTDAAVLSKYQLAELIKKG
jgi:DNA polymerase III subunit gamma/tau